MSAYGQNFMAAFALCVRYFLAHFGHDGQMLLRHKLQHNIAILNYIHALGYAS